MADLSKTAKASMKAGQAPKEKVALTPEKAIKTIREYRESGLMVLNVEYYDILLAEYDKALTEINTLKSEAVEAAKTLTSIQNAGTGRASELEARVIELEEQVIGLQAQVETSVPAVVEADASEPGLGTQGTDSIGE